MAERLGNHEATPTPVQTIWRLHRRDIMYVRDETDDEQLYWPMLVKTDDAVEVSYQVLDDDDVLRSGDDGAVDEDYDAATGQMAAELEAMLALMRERPADVTIHGGWE